MCEPALEQLVQFAHAATAAPADAAQLGRGIGVVWAHSGGFRIRPAIVASNACPCRAGPAPLPLQRLPASTDAGWNAAPHVRRRSLSRRWHVSGPPCAVQALAPFGAAVRCPSAGTLRGRHSLSKRWHLAGPPFPGDMSHPSGRHPVFTKGRGTSMCHLGHIPRARRPFANVKVVASIVRADWRDAVLPPSSGRATRGHLSSAQAGAQRPDGCHARQPGDRSAAQHAPEDAVLPHWGSSGTWMCRARELRQDADVSDDPQCGRTAAPSGADATKRS